MTAPAGIYPFFKGRVALHAILKAAGIGEGDQVLLPGYTCVVVPNAINYTGATPIYLDIEPATFNLDLDRLEDGLGTRWSPDQAKAILVQHTYGIPCDMDRVTEFAKKFNLLVIEDSCHALGSRRNGRLVGTLGDAAFFSSQWSKPVTTGLGGWAVINTPELRKALDQVLPLYQKPSATESWILEMQYIAFSILNQPRLYWLIQSLYRKLGELGLAIGSSSGTELACELPPDYEKVMHPLQLRRLRRLLSRIEGKVAARREKSRLVVQALQAAGLPTVSVPEDCDPVFLRYPLLVQNKEEVLAKARRKQMQLGDWFLSPIHPNLGGWELAGYQPGTCPVGEDVSRRVVNIPTDDRLSAGEIERTVAFLKEVGRF
jgi:perosamine synthetase